MSLVCAWNEVGDVLCQVSSSPFCTRPFWRMPMNISSKMLFFVPRFGQPYQDPPKPPTMDNVCLQKTRFHANPLLGTEPCKWQANPLVCVVQTPYFVANHLVLCGFGASCYKLGGFDSKPPILQKPCPLWGSEGLGRVARMCAELNRNKVESQKTHSELPVRIAPYQCFKRRSP